MDVNNIMAIMEAMQKMKQFQEQQTNSQAAPAEPSASAAPEAAKFYDDPIQSEGLSIMGAAIPFLNPAYQQQMGMFVKILELKKLMDYYQKQALLIQAAEEKDWRRGMLQAVRPHMSQDKKHKIDLLMNALDMQEILTKMKEVNAHEH